MKKIPVKQVEKTSVKIIVDFGTVWAFMWRYFILILIISFLFGFISVLIGL